MSILKDRDQNLPARRVEVRLNESTGFIEFTTKGNATLGDDFYQLVEIPRCTAYFLLEHLAGIISAAEGWRE